MTQRSAWWRRRVIEPVLAQLRQGVTPDAIALTLALGVVLGVFPILGASTLLCGAVGVALRLNQPLIQAVNYLAYPAQLALLIPFYRLGEDLFHSPHVPIFSVVMLVERFRDGPAQFIVDYGRVAVYGVVVWCLVAPPAALLVWFASRPALRRLSRS